MKGECDMKELYEQPVLEVIPFSVEKPQNESYGIELPDDDWA